MLERWPSDHARRASINSFGYGGSNVHVIREEAPEYVRDSLDSIATEAVSNGHLTHTRKILCLSANDSGGIERQARLLAQYLQNHHGPRLVDDLVYTLGQRRTIQKYRCAIQGESIQGLKSNLEKGAKAVSTTGEFRRLAFLFTGQGVQWPRMGCELLATYPIFNATFQAADKHMSSLGAWSLLGKSKVLTLT